MLAPTVTCKLYSKLLSDDEEPSYHYFELAKIDVPANKKGVSYLRKQIIEQSRQVAKISLETVAYVETEQLASAVSTCHDLEVLELTCGVADGECAQTMAAALRYFSRLEALKIHFTSPGFNETIVHVIDHLPPLHILKTLDLWDNNMSERTSTLLGEHLRKNAFPLLEVLRLSQCRLGVAIKPILAALPNLRHLNTLAFAMTNLNLECLAVLTKVAPHLRNMKYFDIGGNNFRRVPDADNCLKTILTHWWQLEVLIIYGCYFSGAAVAEGVSHCVELKKLSANSNNMGDVGIKAVIDALLKCCPRISIVRLANNSASSVVLRAQGVALAQLPSLTELSLSNENMGGFTELEDRAFVSNELQRYQQLRVDHLVFVARCLKKGLRFLPELFEMVANFNDLDPSVIRKAEAYRRDAIANHAAEATPGDLPTNIFL